MSRPQLSRLHWRSAEEQSAFSGTHSGFFGVYEWEGYMQSNEQHSEISQLVLRLKRLSQVDIASTVDEGVARSAMQTGLAV